MNEGACPRPAAVAATAQEGAACPPPGAFPRAFRAFLKGLSLELWARRCRDWHGACEQGRHCLWPLHARLPGPDPGQATGEEWLPTALAHSKTFSCSHCPAAAVPSLSPHAGVDLSSSILKGPLQPERSGESPLKTFISSAAVSHTLSPLPSTECEWRRLEPARLSSRCRNGLSSIF